MSKCIVPPEGWSCSRAGGHDGPCAASRSVTKFKKGDKVWVKAVIVSVDESDHEIPYEIETVTSVITDWVEENEVKRRLEGE